MALTVSGGGRGVGNALHAQAQSSGGRGGRGGRGGTHLARVRVDDAHVALALGADQHDLLHVLAPDVEVVLAEVLLANLVEELDDATQQLLRDALAGAVDAELDRRRAVEHGRGEHGHADGLAEATRRADEHLLRQMVPRVLLQHLLVSTCKAAERLHLPKGARARFQKVLVEEALMEAPIPACRIEERQGIPALSHAHERGLLFAEERSVLLHRANPGGECGFHSLPLVCADLRAFLGRKIMHQLAACQCLTRLHHDCLWHKQSEIVFVVFIRIKN